ncbi:DUF1127 domain-containing protein [Hoeflea sp. WL0058]|uniref:DUF1127 domain-containing protein n=1 Tax=Flavimaribacter sediminis TaxID=2865987 RepID=A0AAE3CZQ9_9HYPH|nr:DUF1127 domain-containing protein [Flavimaribacter sediminis]MBW8637640.1 DUF1127 domain-containing protein [Flavimaribacter sediminis]
MNIVSRHAHGFFPGLEEVFRHLYARVEKALRHRARRYRDIQALRDLQELNDAQLRDIGLMRGDLFQVSRLPMEENATAELGRISRRTKHFKL